MKILLILLLLSLISCDSLQGPEGPRGPKGEKGEPGEISTYVERGILYSADKEEGENYWDIELLTFSDTLLINCYVRKGSGYMWKSPTWLYSDWYVRIFDGEDVEPGYEYIIVAIIPD